MVCLSQEMFNTRFIIFQKNSTNDGLVCGLKRFYRLNFLHVFRIDILLTRVPFNLIEKHTTLLLFDKMTCDTSSYDLVKSHSSSFPSRHTILLMCDNGR